MTRLPATATRAQLEAALARHRVNMYPALYAGYEDDALRFVRNHCRTRSSMLRYAQLVGLAEGE